MKYRDEVNMLKDVIRNPYAWPGGYERALVTTDCGLICHKCARKEYYNMLNSTRGGYNDGWAVDGSTTAEGDEVCCDHCGREIV